MIADMTSTMPGHCDLESRDKVYLHNPPIGERYDPWGYCVPSVPSKDTWRFSARALGGTVHHLSFQSSTSNIFAFERLKVTGNDRKVQNTSGGVLPKTESLFRGHAMAIKRRFGGEKASAQGCAHFY